LSASYSATFDNSGSRDVFRKAESFTFSSTFLYCSNSWLERLREAVDLRLVLLHYYMPSSFLLTYSFRGSNSERIAAAVSCHLVY